MDATFPAFFDGQVLHPEEPPGLVANRRYLVTVAAPEEQALESAPTYPLSEILALATDMGVTDLAERHGNYARRQPEPPIDGQ